MTREEFTAKYEAIKNPMVKTLPTANEYKLIEYVYTWYPTISETKGKEQVAQLYATYGMTIFKDMEKRAMETEEAEAELMRARHLVKLAEDKLRELGKGI